MKKLILISIIVGIILSCTACGSTNHKDEEIVYDEVMQDLMKKYGANDNTNHNNDIDKNTDENIEKFENKDNIEKDNTFKQKDIPVSQTSLYNGVYTFYNESLGGYLSYNGNTLTISTTPQNWILKPYDSVSSYVCVNNADLVLDIDNAIMMDGTAIKLWNITGYKVQLWTVMENADGTFSFISSANNTFCLGFQNGSSKLQTRDTNNASQNWQVVEITDPSVIGYHSYLSSGRMIELQMPLNIHEVISEEKLQEWADNLETAYYTYYELTNYMPYEHIIVEAYNPLSNNYLGYVVNNSNIIHIDCNFIYEDLKKLVVRPDDWNFCVLHEMGHMFDNYRPWTFEAELMTDFKLSYVLEANNVAATPSEFDVSYNFYGKDIKDAYATLGRDFSSSYDIFGCTARFLEIKEEIGWEPFKQTYYEMQNNYSDYATNSQKLMFENFISLLSKYSGQDIKGYFSKGEWNAILNKLNN